MKDSFGREINYLRISITDRCNLRCRYCMPEGIKKVPMRAIMTYEEMTRLCRAASEIGITRIKITGGEPLVRLGCPDLVREIKKIPGIEQVTMTTNGILMGEMADALRAAGLDAVNISLDTLDPEKFKHITGFDMLSEVLEGVRASLDTGMRVKINTVLAKGINDEEVLDLVSLTEKYPLDVRFIEMMPIGEGGSFTPVFNDEVLHTIRQAYPAMAEDHSVHGNGPASYFSMPGHEGTVGFISAMHGRFCSRCNRIRVTSQGKIKPCLCYSDTINIKPLFIEADPMQEKEVLKEALARAVSMKPQTHCFDNVSAMTEQHKMVSIGG